MTTLLDVRSDFPIFKKKINGHPFIYLDTAATAHKPQCVIDAMSSFYAEDYATVHRSVYSLSIAATQRYQQVRCSVQRFINAESSEEIIFTRGTTSSLNLLARSFGKAFLKTGDVIVLSEIEHHSNIVPWQILAKEMQLQIRWIPVNDAGELILESLDALLENARLVSLAHVSNVLGTEHPIKAVISAAHAKGALVCIDGAQAASHLPIDVQDLDVDFYAFSGHKLYGPTGIGILYGKQSLLEQMPPVEGGGDMIDNVSLTGFTANSLPLKFEAGTPSIAEVIGLGSALDYLTTIGLENIHAQSQELLHYTTSRLNQLPNLTIHGTASKKGPILTFSIDNWHPLDLAMMLDCRGIAIRSGHHCSQPTMTRFGLNSAARISFGLYNNLEEIDLFLHHLFSLISMKC